MALGGKKARSFTAKTAFAFDLADSIRQRVKERRSRLGLGTQDNLKTYHQVLREMWDRELRIPGKEEEYVLRAEVLNASDEHPPDELQVFE